MNQGEDARFMVAALILAALLPNATRAQDKIKIGAGESVYNTYCATCHGDGLAGSSRTFDLRKLRADERPRFENSVTNGKGQMPPWKGVLSTEQIDQLWNYIRANAYEK